MASLTDLASLKQNHLYMIPLLIAIYAIGDLDYINYIAEARLN